MNLINSIKLLIIIGFLIQIQTLQAQKFEDYKQAVKGESISIEMVAVKGGSFLMGTKNTLRKADEKPIHQVEVDEFWMGKYEITWKQYDTFVYDQINDGQFESPAKLKELGIDGVTGATAPYVDMSFGMGKGEYPAVNMTQYASLMYCKWLTAKTGVFYRLPTEAEWEYVCKKGKTDEVSQLKDHAWYNENAEDKYEKTGSKKPNALGIYDLLGNVSEWVLDQYDPKYYANSPKKNPWNKPEELYPIVVRGGSWIDTADKICCTNRGSSQVNWKQRDPQIPKSNWWFTDAEFVGFRIVRPKIQPPKQEIEKYWIEAIDDFGIN
jgi:formylglycine-generating enzyme required for sulfatase activity